MEGEVVEEGVAEGELGPAATLKADGGVVCVGNGGEGGSVRMKLVCVVSPMPVGGTLRA